VSRFAVIGAAALVTAIVLPLAIGVGVDSPHTQFTEPEAFRKSFPVWMPAWSFWTQQAIFWIWGLSLGLATFAYWRATRPVGRAAPV
jgi:hypothetical protein